VLYQRDDCHLCEQAHRDLISLQAEIPHKLVTIDVDSSADLQRAYGSEVPVVEVGPYKLHAPFTEQELRITLMAARDRKDQLDSIGDPVYKAQIQRGQTWSSADGFAYWLSNHYLAMFNLIVLFYMALPILAPIFMRSGIVAPAQVIYRVYGAMCHQFAFRSIFLFGEQPVYPRAAAGVDGLLTFSQATGLGEGSTGEELYAARTFIGNETVGYKVALCERDVAIWAGLLLFGLVFALTGRRIPPLPMLIWVVVGIAPVGIDGVSQLISQPPFNFYAFRESTPILRILTGGLFGIMTAWFGYPMTEQAMAETRKIMATKRLRLKGKQIKSTPTTG
jgi:uncharacterized membrane protein